ncbi:hypothetical protein COLSTE_01112 [Collinsella stercoris DSM 13279]|uniref:Uncharacterized protein n=1 Tax=Collinsella stercoris DSM 13279 TaxID=445975 RepID=B6GAL2_9ACTN|nr:hypothetical protein COLSTE_01112 [Collinsella stercoris DSM 13279]
MEESRPTGRLFHGAFPAPSPVAQENRAMAPPGDTIGTFSMSPGHAQKAHLSRPVKGANKR